MPDDTDPSIARGAARARVGLIAPGGIGAAGSRTYRGRPERLSHSRFDRMELVVPSYLLGERALPLVLEDDEVPDQIEEPSFVEHPVDHYVQLRHRRRSQVLTFNRAPRL